MKLFGERASLLSSWLRTRPLPLRVTIIGEPAETASTAPACGSIEPIHYDEAGREYVFRFAPRKPETYVVDRDRIFAFVKKRRKVLVGRSTDAGFRMIETTAPLLPDARLRAYLRDRKNTVDFFQDVRDLQTHPEVERLRRPAITGELPTLSS
ncbi:MAG: hypothetical protein ACXWNZ_07345 [Vulcanimicrobiaceae bacterium]